MNTNDEIKKWLEGQHIWIQEAASRLLTKGTISDTDIIDLVTLIKTSDGVTKTTAKIPLIDDAHGVSVIKLLSLGPVEGIDALNPRKPLDFGTEKLSVVYGQNGSGKSGYTRILRNVCGKPNSTPLKPNVYTPPPQKQVCKLKYSVDGVEQEVEWLANMQAIDNLSSVDIFDASNGRIYLETETETSYIPPSLTLFTELVSVCENVDKVLNDEQQRLVSALPKIQDKYKSTSSEILYTTLKYNISQSQLTKLVTFSSEDEESLKTLQLRLAIADPSVVARKNRTIKAQLDKIKTDIEKGVKAIIPESIQEIRIKLNDLKNKRTIATEGATAFGSNSKLEGIGSDTWRKLWTAAREYSTTTAYVGNVFPYVEEKARCVLCHQELDEEAKNRLQGFESFVQGKLELDAKAAESTFEDAINELPRFSDESAIKTMCQAAELDETLEAEICVLLKTIDSAIGDICAKNIPNEKSVTVPKTDSLIEKLSKLSNEAEKSAIQFEEDAKLFDRTKEQADLLELEARQWVAQQKEAVEAEISRLKKIEEYRQWRKLTGTTGITREAGVVSEKLITESYISRFNDELKKLGAVNIAVELKKTGSVKGRSRHKINLKNLVATGTSLVDVLSDGEKRIVSLAAFLADVTGRNTSTPFIFDDPISSLDQDYEERTIKRLVELSESRQVIVFTHRLSFLGGINDNAKDKLNIVYISREQWGTGEPGNVPIFACKPKEALNELKNARLAKARKASAEPGSSEYYIHAKSICGDFRIILERLVENVLLYGIIQRHSREIHTKNLIQKLTLIQKKDCDLIEKKMTKYSFDEHSQPLESPIPLPMPDELAADIDEMLKWYNDFNGRKVV
ncbi:hypothetical protein FACS189476_01790 [Spirochaetia bacterium]|nr:hypothetical protein FACS189476_01790 [Spirochaetia bacterium]